MQRQDISDMLPDPTYRKDIALVAHKEGRVLVIQREGYTDREWRVPQDALKMSDEDKFRFAHILDTRSKEHRDVPLDERFSEMKQVLRKYTDQAVSLLKNRIDTDYVGAIRYAGVWAKVTNLPGDEASVDPMVTASHVLGKNLFFYIAEIFASDSELRAGNRVTSFRFGQPNKLGGILYPDELHPVNEVLKTYIIDYDAPIEIKTD